MSRHWPMFALRIRTPRLVLRLPTEVLLDDLIDVVLDGIHDPGYMPFGRPWTDAPRDQLPSNTLQFHWQQLAAFTPEDWRLNFVVLLRREDTVAGTQGIGAKQFRTLREVGTGSWVGRRYQGQGIGTEMRAAVLHFAFAGLGAEYANSGAWIDNAPSLRVSRKLGYRDNGTGRHSRRGEAVEQINLRLSRADWEAHRTVEVEIANLEPCLPLFHLEQPVGTE